jgi:translation elongation factor EF-Ts
MNISETIMKHKIKVEPFDNIVYARIGVMECDARYVETGGDEERALELAVSRIVERAGQPVYSPTVADVKVLRESTGRGAIACKQALLKCRGDQAAAADYLRKY